MSSGVTRLVVTRWPPSPLRKLVRAIGREAFCCFRRRKSGRCEAEVRASTSSVDWLCQALLFGCAAPAGAAVAGAAAAAGFGATGTGAAAGAAGAGFGTAGAGAGGGAPGAALSCCPSPAKVLGAAVDAFGPAVSGVEAEAGPALGDGAPVSLCAGLGSLTGLGRDSPADL